MAYAGVPNSNADFKFRGGIIWGFGALGLQGSGLRACQALRRYRAAVGEEDHSGSFVQRRVRILCFNRWT